MTKLYFRQFYKTRKLELQRSFCGLKDPDPFLSDIFPDSDRNTGFYAFPEQKCNRSRYSVFLVRFPEFAQLVQYTSPVPGQYTSLDPVQYTSPDPVQYSSPEPNSRKFGTLFTWNNNNDYSQGCSSAQPCEAKKSMCTGTP